MTRWDSIELDRSFIPTETPQPDLVASLESILDFAGWIAELCTASQAIDENQ